MAFAFDIGSLSCWESLLAFLWENADVHEVSKVFVEVERVTDQQLVGHLEPNVVGQVALHLGEVGQ